MKYVTLISLLLLVSSFPATKTPSIKSLPKSQHIFTIAINPIPSLPTSQPRYFAPESLRDTLPNFRLGEAEIKAFGERRIWESGVIVLNNKEVLFWTTCRKNFLHVLTSDGYVSFIIGDGKENF